jgi:hypothetical protein
MGDDLRSRLAVSALHVPRPVRAVEDWLDERRARSPFHVIQVPFDRLDGWGFDRETGDLVQENGRFFAVEGLRVRTDHGHLAEWEQPIIHQPDVAILGILAREADGVLRFLMQAKMEPGNVNGVQLSPTVQATSSNYLRVHKGARARYVEYFTGAVRARPLVDVLQSEQGSWFRGKRNRNVVMEVAGEVEPHEDFIWLTLGEILALLHRPHLINMDARTVLSCLPPVVPATEDGDGFRAALRRSIAGGGRDARSASAEVRSWLTERKAAYALDARPVPLSSVTAWTRNATEIFHRDGGYFTVMGVSVRASNREVRSWCQPLLAPCGAGLAAYLVRPVGGVLHVLARADVRAGYRDVAEVGATVQCTPDNYATVPAARRPRYLDLVLSGAGRIRYDIPQSEEGGRFQRAVTRHMIVEVGEDFPAAASPDFRWLTVARLAALTRASYQVGIEARSLLLCLQALS